MLRGGELQIAVGSVFLLYGGQSGGRRGGEVERAANTTYLYIVSCVSCFVCGRATSDHQIHMNSSPVQHPSIRLSINVQFRLTVELACSKVQLMCMLLDQLK